MNRYDGHIRKLVKRSGNRPLAFVRLEVVDDGRRMKRVILHRIGRHHQFGLVGPPSQHYLRIERMRQFPRHILEVRLRIAKEHFPSGEQVPHQPDDHRLSRFLMRYELGPRRYHGWYILDDYANWMGQCEEQIADILYRSPEITTVGNRRLMVLVLEAKYIQLANLSVKRRESQKQLRDTVQRVNEAIFGAPEWPHRDLWRIPNLSMPSSE